MPSTRAIAPRAIGSTPARGAVRSSSHRRSHARVRSAARRDPADAGATSCSGYALTCPLLRRTRLRPRGAPRFSHGSDSSRQPLASDAPIREVADRAARAHPLALERRLDPSRETGAHSPSKSRSNAGAASRTSRIWTAYSSQSVASRRTPPSARAAVAISAKAAVTRRRLTWRDLCHGSGKKTHSSLALPRGRSSVSTSGAFASASRRLCTPARSASSMVRASPARNTSTARKSRSGVSAAACTIAWPCPEPISTTRGAERPQTATGSRNDCGRTLVVAIARGTDSR